MAGTGTLPEHAFERSRFKSLKRVATIALGCIVLWYGAISFLMPSLSCGPTAALHLVARSTLQAHFLETQLGSVAFGDVDSLVLRSLLQCSRRANQYNHLLIRDHTNAPVVIVLYPTYSWTYLNNWSSRKLRYSTFVLRRNGLLCGMKTRFDARNPPNANLFAGAGEPADASWCHNLAEVPLPTESLEAAGGAKPEHLPVPPAP